MSPRSPREQGAVAIIVALLLVVFMASVALTVDVGGLYLRRRELVNGADAAALSAARTCARGGADSRFATSEEAADAGVRANSAITADEVSGTNITDITPCGTQWGHVSVGYTSQQALYFAPVLGFHRESPVTTEATASWGLGSNNPVPIVVSSQLSTLCPIPPGGTPTVGNTCAFWYDNDTLGGGNFAFLSLNPHGWNVPIDSNCSQSQSGGTSTLTGWVDGSIPASVSINWTDPTYVCTDTGIRGVGGKTGPNSQLWGALSALKGQTRDFPINWTGPGAPIIGAPDQGLVYQNAIIDKYDIIGFASLKIVEVWSVNEIKGGPGDCTTKNNSPISWTSAGQTLDLNTITDATTGWQGCPSRSPVDAITSLTVTKAKNNDQACCTMDVDYRYDSTTRTITWIGAVPKNTKVSFGWVIDPNNGPCGQPPTNSSAMCVVTQWQGSTLDPTYHPGSDNNTVVRLCDLGYASCLDQ